MKIERIIVAGIVFLLAFIQGKKAFLMLLHQAL